MGLENNDHDCDFELGPPAPENAIRELFYPTFEIIRLRMNVDITPEAIVAFAREKGYLEDSLQITYHIIRIMCETIMAEALGVRHFQAPLWLQQAAENFATNTENGKALAKLLPEGLMINPIDKHVLRLALEFLRGFEA